MGGQGGAGMELVALQFLFFVVRLAGCLMIRSRVEEGGSPASPVLLMITVYTGE
jgi:hypothetical protein